MTISMLVTSVAMGVACFARRTPRRRLGSPMWPSTIPQSRVASLYRPPMPLEDEHILYYLKLAGSGVRAEVQP
jgi:hypothetical protein